MSRRRHHPKDAPASATTMMTGVDPSAVKNSNIRNAPVPVCAAAHRAIVWSIRTTPECVRIMYATTPMPTPTITTASNATVSASPVAVAGSIRDRMNRRSLRHRISWSSTAAVAVRAGSACGHARTAIPPATPTAVLTISRSRMASTTSGSTIGGGGADLCERRSDVRLDRQIPERDDPDRTIGLDDGQSPHLQVLHQIDHASDGVGGGGGDEVPAEDLLDGRCVRVPTLGDGADRDVPVRDDPRNAFGAGLDHDHVTDVFLRHQARGRGQRRVERSEEHTSELQSHSDLVCRLL